MIVIVTVVMFYSALFAHSYHFLYIQTDEGLEPEAAFRKKMARLRYWSILQRTWPKLPLPKQEWLDVERLVQKQVNVECIEEWRLATEEELESNDAQGLQACLDTRNVHSDQIFALLCELDDPINSNEERQKLLRKKIRKLRMASLKELEKQSNSRVQEILRRHN